MWHDVAMFGTDERRYQVFISSTFEDLAEERQKVLQAVLEMKAFPAGMELFPSADEEQWAFIQREIESSDYYVLITAAKYGSVAPDGLSFTEKEYDHAVNLKKCVMSFVRKDLSGVIAGKMELDPARRLQLEAFHRKVKANKLVRFYSNSDELKSQVMQALMHAFQLQPREGWVRAKNARRMEDLEELTRLQKRVMELEAENARLVTTDQTASFAQGDDALTYPLGLTAVTRSNQPEIPAPAESFVFAVTWNDVFVAIFTGSDVEVEEDELERRLAERVRATLPELFPNAKQWLQAILDDQAAGISGKELKRLSIAVTLQFLGLGLAEQATIDKGSYLTRDQTHRVTANIWRLTAKGRLHLLTLRGIRRT